jgi:hypothetical protein
MTRLPSKAATVVIVTVAVMAAVWMLATPSSAAPTNTVAAVPRHDEANGIRVGDDPVVRAGQTIAFTVAGYASRATVSEDVLSTGAAPQQIRASQAGIVHASYRVPAALPRGQYILAVSGPGRDATIASAGSIDATIPQTAFYPFRVTAGLRTPSTS